jgi:hypothetical protein
MERINIDCTHVQGNFCSKYDKIHAMKRCQKCKDSRNQKCNHTAKERAIVGTWATIEVDKALEKRYKLIEIYEIEHFEKSVKGLFEPYVDTFMKYKLEASGCKCNSKFCSPACKNDENCEAKIQYVADNIAYDLNIDKVKYNAGLRFIAKIFFNSLWGHFGMKDNYSQSILIIQNS